MSIILDGTTGITTPDLIDSSLTSGRVVYAGGSGNLTGASGFTFDGTILKVSGAANEMLRLDTSSTAYDAAIRLFQAGVQKANIQAGVGVSGGGLDIYSNGSTPIVFGNSAELMRITSTGLGIGTSSPSNKLTVLSGTGLPSNSLQEQAALVIGETASGRIIGVGTFASGTWIQSSYPGVAGPAYPLILNPSGGAIGIGNSAPTGNLHIGNGSTVGDQDLYLQSDSSNRPRLRLWGGTVNKLEISVGGTADINVVSGLPLVFSTSNTERARIDSSGNFGINTSSPSTFGKVAIQVTGTTTPTTAANVGPASINLYNGGSGGSTDSTMGIFGWHAGDPGIGSGIGFTRESSVDWGTQIRFYTHPTTTSNIGNITERAKFDSAGNFIVLAAGSGSLGKITTRSDGGTPLAVSNESVSGTLVSFQGNGSGQLGSITHNGSGTAYNTTSDYRLKTVVGAVTGHGERLDALEPIEYIWNSNGSRTRGFLAHKFQEVYADSVSGTKDAVDADGKPIYQAMQASSSEVIADLVAEIKSLRKRLADAGI